MFDASKYVVEIASDFPSVHAVGRVFKLVKAFGMTHKVFVYSDTYNYTKFRSMADGTDAQRDSFKKHILEYYQLMIDRRNIVESSDKRLVCSKYKWIPITIAIIGIPFFLGNAYGDYLKEKSNQQKAQAVVQQQVWKNNGCYVYKATCGGKAQRACELTTNETQPFIIGNERVTPYPTCK